MALALPLAALAQNNLNLDAGSTGTSSGDISFGASGISPLGSATLYSLTSTLSGEFSVLSETILAGFSVEYSTTPIPIASLSNDVFAVHTHGGNYAKVLVTAVSSTSITLQYVTYSSSGSPPGAQIQGGSATLGAATGPTGPTIGAVQNNYSNVVTSALNYGIAPGSLMVIYGSGMAAPGSSALPLQNPSNGLPQTLNGSSVSVTVGGKTVTPAFYYAVPSQLAVVLPSSTPVGTGTITVSYGGQISTPAPLKVVASAFGFGYDTPTGTSSSGTLALVTDALTYALITPSNSAKPGEILTFWGSGVGADTKNTDVGPPISADPLNDITALYFGTVQAPISYQGRSGLFPGLDQINVTIPNDAPTGCSVFVAAVSGSGAGAVVSNLVTIPIATNGGACVDPLAVVSPTESSTLSGKGTVKFGFVAISQLTDSSGTTTDDAAADFESVTGGSLSGYESSSPKSYGNCVVPQANAVTGTPPTHAGLDAGSVSVIGPDGTQQPLTTYPQAPGAYFAQLPTAFLPASGGVFTFTGSGGADVGAFTATVNFTTPINWTNSSSDGTVNRASGVTIDWNGGASGTYVQIYGESTSSSGASASFTCIAPVSARTFTVPPPVLLWLPAGLGSLTVSNYTTPAFPTIPNLDFAYAEGYVETDIDATYN
jgi:uncharacterized protein (TIGR03437 family)